ncbi:MAG: trypsin-like peptidase domain-containing protein [Thermoleophilia bacterium]
MSRKTLVKSFLGGAISIVAILVLLVAVGVLPLKTETRTVVQQTVSTAETTTVAATGSELTPEEIYDKYAEGVVEVLATFSQSSASGPFGASSGSSQALGSGFVVSADGSIMTSAHVVSDNGVVAESVSVVFKDDGLGMKSVDATIVGVDETSDVALLKVDPSKTPDLVPLVLGDSSAVSPGEEVVAIGNPLGYDFSVTSGIVSAVHRNLESPNGSVIPNGIQTDAAINSGNSGGPLFNAQGQVIGINEQIATESGGNEGLGFAVPINTAEKVMEQLQASGKVTYAYLGVQGQTLTTDVAEALGIDAENGVLIASVASGSPAEEAGLRGGSQQTVVQGQVYVLGGDVITAVNGESLDSADELVAAINELSPGDEVTLTIVRDGDSKEISVTLGERPTT